MWDVGTKDNTSLLAMFDAAYGDGEGLGREREHQFWDSLRGQVDKWPLSLGWKSEFVSYQSADGWDGKPWQWVTSPKE